MPGTDAPSTLKPADADALRAAAIVTGQLQQLLTTAVPLLCELQAALLRLAPEEV